MDAADLFWLKEDVDMAKVSHKRRHSIEMWKGWVKQLQPPARSTKTEMSIKPAVCRKFLASLGKNSIITFQHIVIQVFWEITRLLHLLMALFSGFKKSSPWQETFANHRSFQRERAFLLSVPIGCALASGQCLVFPQQISTWQKGSQTFSFYS